MRQTELHLGVEDRKLVESHRRKGQHAAREVNQAHVLAALDDGLSESQIMAVLGIGRTAIWRTRAAYLGGGVEYAIHDLERPGRHSCHIDRSLPFGVTHYSWCLILRQDQYHHAYVARHQMPPYLILLAVLANSYLGVS
jgi:hypothetical protein